MSREFVAKHGETIALAGGTGVVIAGGMLVNGVLLEGTGLYQPVALGLLAYGTYSAVAIGWGLPGACGNLRRSGVDSDEWYWKMWHTMVAMGAVTAVPNMMMGAALSSLAPIALITG